jgi:exodeoxyribonuclease VII large subunit
MNKELDFPLAPQKIAVISSQTAAGYKDFMEQLHNNPYQYKFYTKLFPTLLQGEHAEKSIINALEKIFNHENFFDLVVIIRGGGAKSDLGIFDLYELAANIAQYPLPVITGIGHEKDESIADLVAFQKLKTPTAVADFLVEKLYNFESLLIENSDYLKSLTDQYIKQENLKLQSLIYRLIPKTRTHLESEKSHLFQMSQKLKNSSNQIITNQKYKIHNYASNVKTNTALTLNKEDNYLNKQSSEIINLVRKTITNHKNRINTFELSKKYLDPKEIIKRGYSITLKNGKIIKSSENIEKDDHIKTILKKGEIESKVTGTNNKNQ